MDFLIHIFKDRCKGCSLCVEICQVEVLALSEEKNKSGYRIPKVINIESCLGCGMCEMLCPEFAVLVRQKRKENIS